MRPSDVPCQRFFIFSSTEHSKGDKSRLKKKLIFGLVLISLILLVSGLVIIWNLSEMHSERRLIERNEKIINRYNKMFDNLNRAQTALYRRQMGYNIDKIDLLGNLKEFERSLTKTRNYYSQYLSGAECNSCHSAGAKFESVQSRLDHLQGDFKSYREAVRSIIDANEVNSGGLEKRTLADGENIIGHIVQIKHAIKMERERYQEILTASITRSRDAIIGAVVLGILLWTATVLVMIKSISRPVSLLVEAIEKVSSGDYGKKINIKLKDEIGFLAKTFNVMTENLAAIKEAKEALILELQELNNSLDQRVREATTQLEASQEKMLRSETLSAVGTFASGVAHELATPLSSISSYFEMVKDKIPKEGRLSEDISIIEGELLRCRNTLRGMLDFAKPPETEKTATNINAIISEILALVKYRTECRKLEIEEKLAQDLPEIMAVAGQLKQVFLNLILNGLQVMPDGGKLSISTFLAGGDAGRIGVRVSDTGPGIPEGELNKIFQPFYTTRKSGTGLGLAISYGIIKALHGEIEVRSEPGKGTSFFVYLPVLPPSSSGGSGR